MKLQTASEGLKKKEIEYPPHVRKHGKRTAIHHEHLCLHYHCSSTLGSEGHHKYKGRQSEREVRRTLEKNQAFQGTSLSSAYLEMI